MFSICWWCRNIKGFAIQGGDPTESGKGGESIYGKYFDDEFDTNLKVIKMLPILMIVHFTFNIFEL